MKDSPSKSNGQPAVGQDGLEASAEMEASQSLDSDTSPCEASQGAACAAELIAAPDGCPARAPRVCVEL